MSTAIGLGWRGAIMGVVEESVYGTAVTPTAFICTNSDSLSVEEERILTDCINGRYRDEAEVYAGTVNAGGDFGVDLRYQGVEKYLKNLFGAVTTTNTGTLAYNHEFTISDTLPSSLTIEKQVDSVISTGKGFTFSGCHVNSMDFNIEPNGVLKSSVNVVSKECTVIDSVTSPTLLTTPHVMFNQCVISLNSVDITSYVTSLSLTINKMLSEDRYRIGDRTRKEAIPTDKIEVTGSITSEYYGKTLYELFRNNTSVPLTITFTGAEIETSYDYTMSFSMPKVKIMGGTPTITDESFVYEELPFQAFATDSSTREIEINIQNKLTTV